MATTDRLRSDRLINVKPELRTSSSALKVINLLYLDYKMISSAQEQFNGASAVGPENVINQATMKQVREQSSKQNFSIGSHIKP